MNKLWSLGSVVLPLAILAGCGSDNSGSTNPAPGSDEAKGAEQHSATTDNTTVGGAVDVGPISGDLPGNATGAAQTGVGTGGGRPPVKQEKRE